MKIQVSGWLKRSFQSRKDDAVYVLLVSGGGWKRLRPFYFVLAYEKLWTLMCFVIPQMIPDAPRRNFIRMLYELPASTSLYYSVIMEAR